MKEIPCSILDRNKKIRDLTQLVKVKGIAICSKGFKFALYEPCQLSYQSVPAMTTTLMNFE